MAEQKITTENLMRWAAKFIADNPGFRPISAEVCVWQGMEPSVSFHVQERDSLVVFARAVGRTRKRLYGNVELVAYIDGIRVKAFGTRGLVCRRVTKTVTLPAEPEKYTPALPERTVTVDEWDCGDPILAEADDEDGS